MKTRTYPLSDIACMVAMVEERSEQWYAYDRINVKRPLAIVIVDGCVDLLDDSVYV